MAPLKPLPSVRDYRPDVSPYLEASVLRATRISASERWQSTQELRQAIATVALAPNERTPRPAPSAPLPPLAAPTHRVTTRLLMRAAGLSNRQLALAGLGLLLGIVLAIFGLAETLYRIPLIWNNVRFEAAVGPFAYAATRRRFVGGLAHFVVVVLGQWLVLTQIDRGITSVPGLLMGLGMMVIAYVIARRRGYAPEGARAPLPAMLTGLREAGWALVMPVINSRGDGCPGMSDRYPECASSEATPRSSASSDTATPWVGRVSPETSSQVTPHFAKPSSAASSGKTQVLSASRTASAQASPAARWSA